jgi:hypothetical protein
MYVHVRYSQHLETDLGEASITIDGDGAQHEGGDDHDLTVRAQLRERPRARVRKPLELQLVLGAHLSG